MKTELNTGWKFRICGSGEYMPALSRGCNFIDLMNNGVIADPFYGVNEKDAYRFSKYDYEYKNEFEITKNQLEYDDILLCADMLDTICDVYINEKRLFRAITALRLTAWG